MFVRAMFVAQRIRRHDWTITIRKAFETHPRSVPRWRRAKIEIKYGE